MRLLARGTWGSLARAAGEGRALAPFCIVGADAGQRMSTAVTTTGGSLAIPSQVTDEVGAGGRSSVSGITATVFGATGFLGRYIVNQLGRMGSRVIIPYRCQDTKFAHLQVMGDLGQIVRLPQFDIRSDAAVAHAIRKSNVVINLIGADVDTWKWKLEEVHTDIPARIARACAEAGHVDRLLHFSAAGAAPTATSRRLRTKFAGEVAVREIVPEATILRPGPVIGSEDRFSRRIAKMVRQWGPLFPLVDDGQRLVQPTFVKDVGEVTIKAMRDPAAIGRTYDLVGPETLSMLQMLDIICDALKEPRAHTPVPRELLSPTIGKFHSVLGSAAPVPYFNSWFAADMLAENDTDLVADPAHGTYEDLKHTPRSATSGLPLDHVKHYRLGGYAKGRLHKQSDTEQMSESAFGPMGSKLLKYPGLDTW
ncbi:unnamed protein product [Pedinophyceae sp. YPF-701]|nr:unnamed protein product [Pedinophyceae sp. YPF-701]